MWHPQSCAGRDRRINVDKAREATGEDPTHDGRSIVVDWFCLDEVPAASAEPVLPSDSIADVVAKPALTGLGARSNAQSSSRAGSGWECRS